MGVFAKIFGAPEIVKDTVKAVSEGTDKIWFTDEEKSDASLKFLKAYEPFKLTQRYLALILVGTFCFLTIIGCFYILGLGFMDVTGVPPEVVQHRLTVIERYVGLVGGDLGSIVLMIGFLYFGGGTAEGIIHKIRDRI